MDLSDFAPAPNQRDVDLYEIENRALDPDGLVLQAMRQIAPWRDRTLVDLGCGSGYWLAGYAHEASSVIGVEPDPDLLAVAAGRHPDVEVRHGSAEHLPFDDESVDVVHARFAYFFPPDCERGLDEVRRALRPGGHLVVVDNDLRHGEFGALVARSPWAVGQGMADVTDAWWTERGAERHEVMSEWRFERRAEMEAVLRLELPLDIVGPWLDEHPDRLHITYGYVLFSVAR